MPTYQISTADRAPLPASYRAESRHLGYDHTEQQRPFAKYFRAPEGPQEQAREALAAGMASPEHGYEITDAARRLSAPGYEHLETGWTRTEHGTLAVHCLTSMPGVTAAMWDWWFGWHSRDSARYKLWHPEAHQYCGLGEDRAADRTLTDRQRYRNNVSYVDEYVGPTRTRLAIRFVDPQTWGFDDRPGHTTICAHVGPSDIPVAAGWLVHQIRPTDEGCEMRSRFFLGGGYVLALPPPSTSRPAVASLMVNPVSRRLLAPAVHAGSRLVASNRFGRHLLEHCAVEMHHLAGILPDLHAEFYDVP